MLLGIVCGHVNEDLSRKAYYAIVQAKLRKSNRNLTHVQLEELGKKALELQDKVTRDVQEEAKFVDENYL